MDRFVLEREGVIITPSLLLLWSSTEQRGPRKAQANRSLPPQNETSGVSPAHLQETTAILTSHLTGLQIWVFGVQRNVADLKLYD